MVGLFDAELQNAREVITTERLLVTFFSASAAIGTFFPVLCPSWLGRDFNLVLMGGGVAGGASMMVASQTRKQKEKVYSALQKGQMESVKLTMAHAIATDKTVQQIQALRHIAGMVAQLPPWEQQRFVQQFGLQGLIEPPARAIQAAAEPTTVSLPSGQRSFEEVDAELADSELPEIDYSWLDDRFICASKCVFAPKGSGKSHYLAYQALKFVQLHPDGEFWIGDMHYDPDESAWFPGASAGEVAKIVRKRPEDIVKLVRRAKAVLRHRVDNGLKREPKFHLMIDEYDSFQRRLRDAGLEDDADMCNTFLQESQDEGRKYGVDVTIAVHSLKKQLHGVDSTTIAQMDVLALGGALADPNTKFPSDFDAKNLLLQQKNVQSMLGPNQGRACVVRKLNDAPTVEVMPYIDLEQFKVAVGVNESRSIQTDVSSQSGDWLEAMRTWFAGLNGRVPSAEEVKAQWRKLTGKDLNDKGVALLLEKLLGSS